MKEKQMTKGWHMMNNSICKCDNRNYCFFPLSRKKNNESVCLMFFVFSFFYKILYEIPANGGDVQMNRIIYVLMIAN